MHQGSGFRVQECNGGCIPDPSYPAIIAGQIADYKIANPQYMDRLVYLQLWNEPGDPRDFVEMEVYADYLVAAYAAVHQVEDNVAATYTDIAGTFKVMTPGQNNYDDWNRAFNHNPNRFCDINNHRI